MANFTADPCNITIATGVTPERAATTSGGGTVNCNSIGTVPATPASCYRFLNWTLNGAVVSSSASYTLTANSSQTLVANFALNTYTISTGVTPSGAGSVGGGGTVNCGSSVTVTATPAAGYNFANWTENGA